MPETALELVAEAWELLLEKEKKKNAAAYQLVLAFFCSLECSGSSRMDQKEKDGAHRNVSAFYPRHIL